MQRCAYVRHASDVWIVGAVACISLFILLVLKYVVTLVVCMCFKICLIRVSMMFWFVVVLCVS